MNNIKKLLFDKLKETKNDYLILRNYDDIKVNEENDIDILISRNLIKDIYKILENELIQNKFEILQLPDKTRINFLCQEKFLSLDFHYELSYYGIKFADTNQIFKNKFLNKDGIFLLKKEYSSLISLINRFLHKRDVKKEDLSIIKKSIKKNDVDFIFKILKNDLANLIIRELKKDNINFEYIRIRFLIILRFSDIKNLIIEINYRFIFYKEKSLKPKGGFLVLIGTHGAGKTSTIESLKKLIDNIGLISNVIHSTSRPGLLPNIYKSKNIKKTKLIEVNQINKFSKKTIILHLFRLIYHVLDYWLFWLRAYKNTANSFFIFDRFLYDYLVEPRNTYAVPLFIKKFIFLLAPKPSLLVILWETPERIYERKNELSLSRLKYEINEYYQISKIYNSKTYRTNVPSTIIAKDILKNLLLANNSLPKF